MISHAIIVALIVYFIHACTWDGMVFSIVRKSTEKLPTFLKKPLYDCPTCMSIWWGNPIVCIGILKFGWVVGSYWEVIAINTLAAGMLATLGSLGDAINKKCDCGRKNRIQDYLNQNTSNGTEST